MRTIASLLHYFVRMPTAEVEINIGLCTMIVMQKYICSTICDDSMVHFKYRRIGS